jgi:limonene-1,2-epoxide hydrolase
VKEPGVATTAQEIFERYVRAGAMTRNPQAVADLFTPDGVIEAPFVPAGHLFPRRMAGPEEIRSGLAAFYGQSTDDRTVDMERSRLVLHETTDPDVFIAEIDTVVRTPGGADETISLVQIFRIRDGKIVLLRDYFLPDVVY